MSDDKQYQIGDVIEVDNDALAHLFDIYHQQSKAAQYGMQIMSDHAVRYHRLLFDAIHEAYPELREHTLTYMEGGKIVIGRTQAQESLVDDLIERIKPRFVPTEK